MEVELPIFNAKLLLREIEGLFYQIKIFVFHVRFFDVSETTYKNKTINLCTDNVLKIILVESDMIIQVNVAYTDLPCKNYK